ncbi:MAG: rhomboid family intramembrane serine protease [Bacteroidota bacterium]|nr:rhomboid family intramembrane serine protease [Bacteroidota bacterium]
MTEFRPSRFQILPLVIKNLLIINGLFFLAQNTIGKQGIINMDDLFALHTWQSPLFRPWQFVTHLFMHGGFDHIFSNMFALWMFGSVLENLWGPKRFLTFYISCGLGAAFCHMIVLYIESQHLIQAFNSLDAFTQDAYRSRFMEKLNEATLGASGAVFGCLAAFGYLFPNTRIYLYFFVPVKAKWFVIFYAAFELYMAVANSAGDNVAHVAHLGGALVGIILVYFWNKRNRRTFY